jgi:site-specific recombinase XerD
MSDFLEQFSTYLRAEQGAAENTVSSYLFDVRRFEEWLGSRDKRIETVTRAEIQEYFAWLMQDGVSARSVRRALATLKRFYGLLLDD